MAKMKKIAEATELSYYGDEVGRIKDAIEDVTKCEILILTDGSTMSDFLCEDEEDDAREKARLVSERLGVEVAIGEFLVDIAKKMRRAR